MQCEQAGDEGTIAVFPYVWTPSGASSQCYMRTDPNQSQIVSAGSREPGNYEEWILGNLQATTADFLPAWFPSLQRCSLRNLLSSTQIG
jgi:hypothetical protein